MNRDTDSFDRLRDELAAGKQRRHQEAMEADWLFRTADGRLKLFSLSSLLRFVQVPT